MRRVVFTALIAALSGGALAFRLPKLDLRPMHVDEAVQAVKTGHLLDTGEYRYDPGEHHGPTLYYFALPALKFGSVRSFAESTEFSFRIVPVLFGAGLVLLLILFGDALGRPAALCAGILTALSPAMVFYSRYYIQEMLLVFFTCAAIGCGWHCTRACAGILPAHAAASRQDAGAIAGAKVPTRALAWALASGVFAGLMYATKETSAIAFAALAWALLATVLWGRAWHAKEGRTGVPARLNDKPTGTEARPTLAHGLTLFAAAALAAIVVAVVWLSSFFSNAQGPLDSLRAYGHYLQKGAGGGEHSHPWHFYFSRLFFFRDGRGPWWSEGAIAILAAIGFVSALRAAPAGSPADDAGRRPGFLAESGERGFARFLGFYTLASAGIYSLLPYKTPWCMLGFLHGMILLAGVGAARLLRAGPPTLPGRAFRILVALVLAAAYAHLGWQSWRANFKLYDHTSNPYVYAQTSSDILKLERRALQIAQVHPDGYRMRIHVFAPPAEAWPLPWYLRRFEKVGYWSDPVSLSDPDAPLIVSTPEAGEELAPLLRDEYQPAEFYGSRPQVLLAVRIRRELWQKYLETKK